MRLFSLIILLLVVLIGASFAIINATEVTINYYIGHMTLPLSLLLIITFILGVFVGMAVMLCKVLRLKKEVWSSTHKAPVSPPTTSEAISTHTHSSSG